MKGHTHLTASQREIIKHLRQTGMSYGRIAKAVNVTYNQVLKLLNYRTFTARKERRGQKSVLTEKEKRRIKRLATKDLLSSTEIKATLGTEVSSRPIRQHLQSDKLLKYGRLYGRPRLTNFHKKARLEWAEKYIDLGPKWKNIIFSARTALNDFGIL